MSIKLQIPHTKWQTFLKKGTQSYGPKEQKFYGRQAAELGVEHHPLSDDASLCLCTPTWCFIRLIEEVLS